MKRPLDPWEDMTEDEKNEKLDDLRDLEVTKKEERAMIWAALKTILPPVIIILAILYAVVFLIFT